MSVQTNQSSRPFSGESQSVLVVRDESEPALGRHEAGVLGENRRRTKSHSCGNSGTSARMCNRQPNPRLDA